MENDYQHIFYNTERFIKLFIDVNFDNYFIEQNNNLLNSNEYYLTYKNEYILFTENSFNTFKIFLEEFKLLDNNYIKTNTNKYIYHFVDKEEYNIINNKLKNIIEIQKKKIEDFLNYIKFLNSTQLIKQPPQLIKQQSIKALSKLKSL